MSKRILHVTLHADNPQFDEREVMKLVDKAPDWVHYAPDCWLLFTSLSPGTWYKRLKTIIGENDELLVMPVELDEYEGCLNKSVWDWIQKHAKKEHAA